MAGKDIVTCIEKVTNVMRKEQALITLKGKLLIAGDTHGDVVVTKAIITKFFEERCDHVVFLGDYIDRAPAEIGSSLPNITYLLNLKEHYPHKVFLLKGNHEAHYALPYAPYEFEREVARVYQGLHEKYVDTFKQMPLMAMVNNIFAAHGGILKGFTLHALKKLDKNDLYAIEALTWSDPVISQVTRGAGHPYDEGDLQEFLKGIGARFFIKGHDYTTLGMLIYGRCLTIFSSRRYARMGNGGVLVAIVEEDVTDVEEIQVKNYSEGTWKAYSIRRI